MKIYDWGEGKEKLFCRRYWKEPEEDDTYGGPEEEIFDDGTMDTSIGCRHWEVRKRTRSYGDDGEYDLEAELEGGDGLDG